MTPLRRDILSAVIEAMHFDTPPEVSTPERFMDYFHAVGEDHPMLEEAEDAVDEILRSLQRNGYKVGEDNFVRYEPKFPLSRAELNSLKDVAWIIRSKLPTMDTDKIQAAARLIAFLEALPKVAASTYFSVSFNSESGHSATIEITPLSLEFGITTSFYDPDVGSDHTSDDLFMCTLDRRSTSGDLGDWLSRVHAIAEDGSFNVSDNS